MDWLAIHGLTTLGVDVFAIAKLNYALCGDQCFYDYLPDSALHVTQIIALACWLPASIMLISTLIYTLRMGADFKRWGWFVSILVLFLLGGLYYFASFDGLLQKGNLYWIGYYNNDQSLSVWTLVGLHYNGLLLVTALGIWGFAWFGPTTRRQIPYS